VTYAKRGEIRLIPIERNGKRGLTVVAKTRGWHPRHPASAPGRVFHGGAPGPGAARVKRLMDEMEIVSEVGVGTTVTAKKWRT